MPVVKVENDVVVQRWLDVSGLAEFVAKYGLTGPEYVESDAKPAARRHNGTFHDRPSRDHEWDGSQWVEAMVPKRARASMSRMDFAIAAATAGYVTFEVAEDWAAGNSIPTEVAGAIAQLPAEEQGPARIIARCKDKIERNGDLMPIIAAAFGADDAALDALYGL